MKRRWLWLLLLILPLLGWLLLEHQARLRQAPGGLGLTEIVYAREKAWGIGLPGDNETGIVIYRLKPEMALRVAQGGAPFLDRQVPPGEHGWNGWNATPIRRAEGWTQRDGVGDPYPTEGPVNLRWYLAQHGFEIEIDPAKVDRINRALNAPGAYFAYDRHGGLAIVMPREGWVAFAYAG